MATIDPLAATPTASAQSASAARAGAFARQLRDDRFPKDPLRLTATPAPNDDRDSQGITAHATPALQLRRRTGPHHPSRGASTRDCHA